MKSFSPAISPNALIDGFLTIGTTVLVPTMSWSVFSAPKPKTEPVNDFNAEGDGTIPNEIPRSGFSRRSNQIGSAMGVLPRVVLEQYPRIRGNHPLASFTAVGPRAAFLVEGQERDNPLDPLKRLAEQEGFVFLLGTQLTSATILHLAEDLAGIPRLRRWALIETGEVVPCDVTGCSLGFEKLSPILSEIETLVEFSGSRWRIFPAREMLEIATDFFLKNPLGGICEDLNCIKCLDRKRYYSKRGR